MLSILIPTYNWDVTPLVDLLHQELKETTIPFEIIVLDDASVSDKQAKNKEINTLTNCSFSILPNNIGRSAIRNLLASKAQYNWLLFLDADTLPTNKNFIQCYLNEILDKRQVIVGGVAYKDNGNSKKIRWKLGKKVEEKTADYRRQNPYKYFFTGNFLIKKSVFKTIRFDESLKKYGYEDLVFAKALHTKNIPVFHIDNTVFHLGIDDNEKFIAKTKEALNNLSVLFETGKVTFTDTRIFSLYKKIRFSGILKLLGWFKKYLEKKAIKQSSLLCYNLLRLVYLNDILKNTK